MMRGAFPTFFLAITLSVALAAPAAAQIVLEGNIDEDMTLESGNEYLLRGAVFVDSTVTLTVEPGVTVKGERVTTGTLIISRGGMLMCEGTAENPIVFTSDQASPNRGDWGGLIINGRAPINTGFEAEGEGNTGFYGGDQPDDNSGSIKYTRVEYAGIEFSPDNELNGIAFQGVGCGTMVEYCQVHMNQDDGIEFFGGTVDARYLLCTNIRDDNFDWTDGWVGRGQFWVCQQRADDADNGFEADNNGENNDLQPRSNPTIYNVTLIGDPTGVQFEESDTGMLLREGTAGTVRNAIIMGFNKAGIDIDHDATFQMIDDDSLTVQNCIFYDNREDYSVPSHYSADDDGFDEEAWATTAAFNNYEATAAPVINAYDLQASSFASMGEAIDGTVPVAVPPDDGFFDTTVDYIGAVDPDYHWTTMGWTNIVLTGTDDPVVAGRSSLTQTWPNPSEAGVTIRYSVAQPGPVSLAVYDTAGRLVTTLISGAQDAGTHAAQWNGAADPGVYFYRLDVGSEQHAAGRIVLLK